MFLTVVTVSFAALGAAYGWMGVVESISQQNSTWGLIQTFSVALAATFLAGIASIVTTEDKALSVAMPVVSFMTVLATSLDLSYRSNQFSIEPYFMLNLMTQMALAYGVITIVVSLLRLEGNVARIIPLSSSLALAIFGMFAVLNVGGFSIDALWSVIGLARNSTVIVALVVSLLICSFSPRFKLNQDSIFESLKLRLQGKKDQNIRLWAFFYLSVGLIVSGVLMVQEVIEAGSVGRIDQPTTGIDFTWFPIIYLTWNRLEGYLRERPQSLMANNITAASTKRFLARHGFDISAWAATVGLRTSSFTIDHDSVNRMRKSLPATVAEIRSEEIKRILSEILQGRLLHQVVQGYRIQGAIDPEISMRPCVDVLRFLSSIHLLATRMVENRLNGLTEILPMVDPDLAQIVSVASISEEENPWFFYFDYTWVDQHIIQTSSESRYGVHIGSVEKTCLATT